MLFFAYRSLVFVSMLLLTGCISFSTMQTAHTLAPGRTSGYLAAVGQTSRQTGGVEVSEDKDESKKVSSAFFEGGVRVGVVDSIDIGVRSNFTLGSFFSDVKFRMFEAEKLTLSGGLGASYLSFGVSPTNQNAKFQTYELHAPLYTTLELHKFVDLTVTPRVIIRQIVGMNESAAFVGSVGLFIGKKVRGVLEYSFMDDVVSEKKIHQVTAGVMVGYPKWRSSSKRR